MQWQVLSCPQCGGPLPKQARWRMVACPYCQAQVGLGPEMVRAATFRAAWQRAQNAAAASPGLVVLGRQTFRVLTPLGESPRRATYLAERLLPTPALATLTLARSEEGAAGLRHEAEVLRSLRLSEAEGGSALARRLPLVLAFGACESVSEPGRVALALSHPPWTWGSLAQVQAVLPGGVEPAHAVWMWRRILESLSFVHASGWVHSEITLPHLMVHPHDHLVHLVGWHHAQRAVPDPGGSLLAPTVRRDLVQSGWAIRSLLAGPSAAEPGFGAAPKPLADLLRRVTEDSAFARGLAARDLNDQVAAAARQAFGAPRFLHFQLPAR